MRTLQTLATAAAVGLLAGCSGGGASQAPIMPKPAGTTAPVLPTTPSSAKTTKVKATIVFPKATKTAKFRGKHRQYVSPDTEGLVIEVDQVGSGGTTAYSITGYDLTTNSSNTTCTPVVGGTSCTFYFNAPVTTSDMTDAFTIFAYNAPQTTGALTAGSYTPAGDLLSQDVSDPVPSATNSAILVNQTNALSFLLLPVVFAPVANIGGSFASPLVLSVSGSGGTTNAVAIDGYDAGDGTFGNEIASYLAGGDDLYVNPMPLTTSTTDFTPSLASLTSALTDSVTVAWPAGSAATNQPASATSTAYSGTLTATASLTGGGFEGTETFAPMTAPVTIAPLFAFSVAAANPSPDDSANTVQVYALQVAIPTGQTAASYAIAPDPNVANNACASDGFSASAPTTTGLTGSQQAMWTVTVPTSGTPGTSCTYAITDGISSTDVTALVPTIASGTIVIPAKPVSIVQQTSGVADQNTPGEYGITAQQAGDTLFCLVSFYYNANIDTNFSNNFYSLFDETSTSETQLYGGSVDVTAPGQVLNFYDAQGPLTYWCGEFGNTESYSIFNANGGYSDHTEAGSTTGTVTPTSPQDKIIIGAGANNTVGPYDVVASYARLFSNLGQSSLDVQALTVPISNPPGPLAVTFTGGDGNVLNSGIYDLPYVASGTLLRSRASKFGPSKQIQNHTLRYMP